MLRVYFVSETAELADKWTSVSPCRQLVQANLLLKLDVHQVGLRAVRPPPGAYTRSDFSST